MTVPSEFLEYEKIGDHVSIYLRKKFWYYYYRLNRQCYRGSLKTRSRREAFIRAHKLDQQVMRGENGAPPERISIDEAVSEYLQSLKSNNRSPKTLSKYTYVLGIFKEVCAQKKFVYLDQVSPRSIDGFREKRMKRSEKTVYTDLVILKQFCNYFVDLGVIPASPLKRLKLRKPQLTPQPFWSRPEVERILAAASEYYRPLFTFLWLTGVRISEAKWLRIEDIDFERKIIWIRPKDGWKPKSGNTRCVPMSNPLMHLLEERTVESDWVFPAKVLGPGRNNGPLKQLCERRALAHLKQVLKRVGLRGKLHSFRHSFISYAVSKHKTRAFIRRWVGHVDDRMLDLYTHVTDRQSAQEMEELF